MVKKEDGEECRQDDTQDGLKIARKVERQAGSKVGRWKTGFGDGI